VTAPTWIADEQERRARAALDCYFSLPEDARALATPGQYVDQYMAALPPLTWTAGTRGYTFVIESAAPEGGDKGGSR
jgi:hypothetical protein